MLAERSGLKIFRITRVDEYRRAIHFVDVRHRVELDLGRAVECTPHRNAERIASDVREAGCQ